MAKAGLHPGELQGSVVLYGHGAPCPYDDGRQGGPVSRQSGVACRGEAFGAAWADPGKMSV